MSELKVDFGGEGHYKNGVLTVNIDPSTAPDVVCNITSSAGELERHFKYLSIDQITCAHTLEHLPAIEIFPTLRYWHSFLKPTGRLLVIVPDLDTLVRDYVAGLIGIEIVVAIIFRRTPYQFQSEHMQHFWGWNEQSLSAYLRATGYHSIQPFGKEIYADSWPFDTPGMEQHPRWNDYRFKNLRLMAYAEEYGNKTRVVSETEGPE